MPLDLIKAVIFPTGVAEEKVENLNIAETGQIFETFRDQLGRLAKTLTAPSIYLPVLFIFLWRATPSAGEYNIRSLIYMCVSHPLELILTIFVSVHQTRRHSTSQ